MVKVQFSVDIQVLGMYVLCMNNKQPIKVADEVWIGTALLHREQPETSDFSIREIVDRVAEESIAGRLRPGVQVHASVHCVANKRPNPGNYRMLYETGRGRRRLFKVAIDDYHSYREGGKVLPQREIVPERYWDLLEWYRTEFLKR